MSVLTFLLSTNADIYDKVEVQVMQKGLLRDVAAEPNECAVGWKRILNEIHSVTKIRTNF